MEYERPYLDEPYRGLPIDDAPPGEAFLQWKGTDACFDFTCPECEWNGHVDGYFAHGVICQCGAAFEMPVHVYPRRVTVLRDTGFVRPEYDDYSPPDSS